MLVYFNLSGIIKGLGLSITECKYRLLIEALVFASIME